MPPADPFAPTGPVYEVRCPRCQVSFPVETRVCVHCGGRTAPAGTVVPHEPPPEFDPLHERAGRAPTSIEPSDETPFVFRDSSAGEMAEPGVESPSESPNLVRSILGNLGGFVWVLLLIAFSIARSCEE